MSEPDSDPLTPSILDRLLGEDLPTESDLVRFRARIVRRRKQSLCRDLENLLNTRWRCKTVPPDLTELETSLVNYGIPDFTGTDAESLGGRDSLLQTIQSVIERFEPRVRQVKVLPVDDIAPSTERVLRFRIEGILRTDGDPELVAFTSTMEPASGNFRVERNDG